MKKPSVAIIGLKGLPAFGGAATVGENVMAQLKDQFNFTVYAVDSHTNKHGNMGGFYQHVFKSFPIKKLNILVYYFKSAMHCLFFGNYNVVHLHHIDGAFMLPFLRLRFRVVVTAHAQPQVAEKWPAYAKSLFVISEKIVFWLANEITTVAEPLQQLYSKLSGRKVHYVPNGIDATLTPSSEPVGHSDYILFAAGRIIPLKGLHFVLSALKKMDYKGKFLVLGDLEQMPSYKEEILKLADGLNVEFLGLVKDKQKLLRYIKDAKLFIFPSYSENMSIMLLEVASMQAPLICSDIPENKVIFGEDEVLFFESSNVEDLKEKIEYALNNPEDMMGRAHKALDTLKENYLWDKITARYAELFKKQT
ncbi:MAG: glycosyltransferase family 4 protein [Bacteroidales bacterium]|nr:glycosyltransferase family 4 protein [Bacteroidales bacterium]